MAEQLSKSHLGQYLVASYANKACAVNTTEKGRRLTQQTLHNLNGVGH
jgi:hypothetical protein